jgi:leader peptidase (prepilin peptidase)/N-methyltransferase
MSGTVAYVVSLGAFGALAYRRFPSIVSRTAGGLALCGAALVGFLRAGDPLAGVLVAALVVCTQSDLRTGLVFDDVTAAAAAVLYAWSFVLHASGTAVAGAVLASLPFLIVHAASRGRAMGRGDAKLAALIGLALGVSGGLASVGAAFVIGAGWGCTAMAAGKLGRKAALPFAPFLSLGASVTLACPGVATWLIG